MPEFVPVVAAADVPEGRGVTVMKRGRMIAVFNLNGEYRAMDGACPHKGGPLGDGYCENGKVYCPLHGWEFDIRTGACKDRPDKPAQPLECRLAGDTIEVAL